MSWIDRKTKLPDKTKKYLVVINCDGVLQEGYCTFNIKKNKFHFDMPHINWEVIKWLELPEY